MLAATIFYHIGQLRPYFARSRAVFPFKLRGKADMKHPIVLLAPMTEFVMSIDFALYLLAMAGGVA
jgi:hypothetical protein